MAMQNIIDLARADGMPYRFLVGCFYSGYFYQFAFFCLLPKRCKEFLFLCIAHIAPVPTIMASGYCIKAPCSVFRYKCRDICGMIAADFRYFF